MQKKYEKVCSVAFLGVIFVLAGLLFFGKWVNNLTGKNLGEEKKEETNTISINWAELYPRRDTGSAVNEQSPSLTERYEARMEKLNTIGTRYASLMPGYWRIGNIGFALDALVSDPTVGIGYSKLNNGMWYQTQEPYSDEYVSSVTASAVSLKQELSQMNIPFVYVQAPYKICQYDSELPFGREDSTNANLDKILENFKENDVDTVDMRQLLHEDGKDHYSMFYVTDHHWNVESGLWAAGKIENILKNQYGLNIKPEHMNEEDYERVTYRNAMFGSAGKAVTHFLAEPEDFDMLYPKFDTDFSLVIPDKGIDARGTFKDLFVDQNTLNKLMDEGSGFAYETLLYGNRPLVQITNHNNPDGPRILMIRDSMSLSVAPYLAMECSELDLIDPREERGDFYGGIMSYIDVMKPDMVMMLASDPEWLPE